MDELGDDLLLLAARPDGRLALSPKFRFGLSGAELVRLAAARRVDIVRGHGSRSSMRLLCRGET